MLGTCATLTTQARDVVKSDVMGYEAGRTSEFCCMYDDITFVYTCIFLLLPVYVNLVGITMHLHWQRAIQY